MHSFLTLVTHIGVTDPRALAALEKKLHHQNYSKGDVLQSMDEVANTLHFIEKGLVRSWFYREKKDVTLSFSLEGEFITAFSSFVQNAPSKEQIEWLEDGQTVYLKREDLYELYQTFPTIERLGRTLTEQYYIRMEERMMFFKFKTALERYVDLLDLQPELIRRAPLQYIATYLDISVETLSRIRSKLRNS